MTSRSGETARTLVLIGLIFQVIEVVILLAVGLIFLIVPLLGILALGIAFLGFLWVICVYLFSYARISAGEYEEARTPTLVFALLTLLTGGILPGVLYLIGWVKLGDAPSSERIPHAW